MTLGRFLEEFIVARSRAGIEKLLDLTPRTVRIVLTKNGNSDEKVIDAKEVAIDNLIKVLPGKTVLVDDNVVKGEISIDQSVMTGESVPVDKIKEMKSLMELLIN